MNRRELVAAVAAHTDQDPKAVDQTLRGLVDVVSATIKKGDPVVMSGFTKWTKVKRAARTARNPQTGEPVKVKASQKVRITPLKALKDVAAGTTPAPKLNKPTAKKAATTTRRARSAEVDVADAAEAPVKRTRAAKAAAPGATTARRTTRASDEAEPTKKATARKATTRKAATDSTTDAATNATARKATARKATATKAAATKATAKKATAKRAPAKRAARA